MPQELGAKDVLDQLDTRLGNVEQEIRQLRTELRTEMSGRFAEVNNRFAEVNNRFAEVNGRFDRLEGKLDTTTRWLVGLILLSWLSLMVSIWLKP